jgi:hypothetical protein
MQLRAGLNARAAEQSPRLAAPAASHAAPVQRKLTPPALIPGAAITATNDVRGTDTVAVGPAQITAYDIALSQAADLEAATAEARKEYGTIGTGLKAASAAIGYQGRFLSQPALARLCGADGKVATTVYGILQGHGALSGPEAALTKPPEKQALLKKQGGQSVLTPANLNLLRNNAAIPINDPIKAVLLADYGTGTLTLTVDFSEGQKGYVTKVAETASRTDSVIEKRPNFAGEFPLPRASDPKHTVTRHWADYLGSRGKQRAGVLSNFSNVHHTATNDSAGTLIGHLGTEKKSREQIEGGIDAITKVVAEGGRFVCVAALGYAIRNDSIFYARMPDEGPYRSIEFRSLWKLWQDQFSGDYAVPDRAVAEYLTGDLVRTSQGMTETATEPAATGHNYNVATNAIR